MFERNCKILWENLNPFSVLKTFPRESLIVASLKDKLRIVWKETLVQYQNLTILQVLKVKDWWWKVWSFCRMDLPAWISLGETRRQQMCRKGGKNARNWGNIGRRFGLISMQIIVLLNHKLSATSLKVGFSSAALSISLKRQVAWILRLGCLKWAI